MILYGDIGGTKSQFFSTIESQGSTLQVQRFENRLYKSFSDLLQHHLRDLDAIESVYLSVAGPVVNNQCQLTNLDWQINADDLRATFGFKRVHLLNDLAATAYAAAKLGPEDYISLQGGMPRLKESSIAVMSVGTGLGESVVVWIDKLQQYQSVGGEGGHRNFAPRNALEQSLSEFIQHGDKMNFFDTEKLISGQGLSRIYRFFCSSSSPQTGDSKLDPSVIVDRAKQKNDPNAVKALDLFIDLIASEAANVALQYYSDSGVIIAGGVPLKIAELIDRDHFVKRFRQHATFSNWLGSVPLVFCTNYFAPIVGLQYYREITC